MEPRAARPLTYLRIQRTRFMSLSPPPTPSPQTGLWHPAALVLGGSLDLASVVAGGLALQD